MEEVTQAILQRKTELARTLGKQHLEKKGEIASIAIGVDGEYYFAFLPVEANIISVKDSSVASLFIVNSTLRKKIGLTLGLRPVLDLGGYETYLDYDCIELITLEGDKYILRPVNLNSPLLFPHETLDKYGLALTPYISILQQKLKNRPS